MEFLKKILVPLVVMALGAVDVSAMDQQVDQDNIDRVDHNKAYFSAIMKSVEVIDFLASLTDVQRISITQAMGKSIEETWCRHSEVLRGKGIQGVLKILQDIAGIPIADDSLRGTGAEVWHLVSSCGKYIWSIVPISGDAQYVWSKVPNTLPYGLPQGLVEAGLTVMLPIFLDQALGICYMDTSPCPHEGIHWKLLAGWSVVGICSAVHLTKYLFG